MRIHARYLALARVNGGPDGPRRSRDQANVQPPRRPNGRAGARYQELVGVGVLLAAVVVLLWSDSLVILALGALLLALLLFAVFLVFARRRVR